MSNQSGQQHFSDTNGQADGSINDKFKNATKKMTTKAAEKLDGIADKVDGFSSGNEYIDDSKDSLSKGVKSTSQYLKDTDIDLNKMMEAAREHIKRHSMMYAAGAIVLGVVLNQMRSKK